VIAVDEAREAVAAAWEAMLNLEEKDPAVVWVVDPTRSVGVDDRKERP